MHFSVLRSTNSEYCKWAKNTISWYHWDREARGAELRCLHPHEIYQGKLCMSSDKHKDNLFFGSLWEIPVFLNQCFLLYIISHYFHLVPTLRNTKISFFLFPYRLHLLLQPYWFLRLQFTEHAPFVITVHLYSSFNCILIIWLWNMN